VLKRTTQSKLTLYRRHAGSCSVPTKVLDQCECPIWIHGKVRGKFLRESLDTRSLTTALQRKQDLLNGNPEPDGPQGGMHIIGATTPKGSETIEFAAAAFLKANEKLAANTLKSYRNAVNSFSEWAAKHELTLLRHVETPHIQAYFDELGSDWKRNTKQGRLVHLRVFFNYCVSRRWIVYPPTKDRSLNHKRSVKDITRKPFTPAEITRILAAVEKIPAAFRDRARALVLLLLYTGMRISDATFFERSAITERNTADYTVIKTRRQISLPPELQKPVLKALAKLPATRVYFFQPDQDDDYNEARTALRDSREFSEYMPQYNAKIEKATWLVKKVLTAAGLEGACHRFRDTFAINLLTQGCDIFAVSQMLGHSDVRITQAHYLKLIPGYHERLSQSTRALSYQFPLAS
jgi:integrase/recombinase XerD